MSLVWKYRRGKIWYLAYASNLGRIHKSLKTENSRLAEAIRAKEENDLLLGQVGISRGPSTKIQLSAFVELYLQHKTSEGTSAGTVRNYALVFNAFGAFLKSDIALHQIDRKTIEAFLTFRRSAGLLEKSLLNDLTSLSTAFRWAMQERYLAENPCTGVKRPRVPRRPPDYLKEEEFLAVREALKDPFLKAVVDFYVLTGVRRSEGIRIEFEKDVDLGARVLHIGQPKQANYRAVPISEELADVILKLKAMRKAGEPRLIPLTKSALYNRFKRSLAKAGIRRNVRLHSLRHTFGTWLADRGATPRNLQELMGHSSMATTQKYVHAVSEGMRRDMFKLSLPKRKGKR